MWEKRECICRHSSFGAKVPSVGRQKSGVAINITEGKMTEEICKLPNIRT